ncbi:MAG: hypothetical protein JJT81_17100 [Rubellimicrobium sp.]|nr:hypothetical protein [Rubellimicrobium sp.]
MNSIVADLLLHLGPVVYLLVQYQALRRWRGLWTIPAVLPMGVMGAAGMAVYLGLSRGADMAPFLFVLAAAACLLWLALFGSLHRIFHS